MKKTLHDIKMGMGIEEIGSILESSTIFDKIEFSGITKEVIREKILDLENRQVPQRKVLLECSDARVAEYWFKNWLHPSLKHAVPRPPKDIRGLSREGVERDRIKSTLRFYENGQQNFNYTLDDIKNWLNS